MEIAMASMKAAVNALPGIALTTLARAALNATLVRKHRLIGLPVLHVLPMK
jgi:hypothetical protein